ncbi:MAG: AAA family ATPase [Elusimicrobiota bacterium]
MILTQIKSSILKNKGKILYIIFLFLIGLVAFKYFQKFTFYPYHWILLICGLIPLICLINPGFGMFLLLLSMFIPLAKVNFEIALILVIISLLLVFSSTFLLPCGFLLLSIMPISYWLTSLEDFRFLIPILAGFLYKRTGGAVFSGFGCLWWQSINIGNWNKLLHTFYGKRIIPDDISLTGWLEYSFKNLKLSPLLKLFLKTYLASPYLIAEILLWIIVGLTVGILATSKESRFKIQLKNILIVAVILVSGYILLPTVFDKNISTSNTVVGILISSVSAIVICPLVVEANNIKGLIKLGKLSEPEFKFIKSDITWDNLGGLSGIKSELEEVLASQFDSEFRENLIIRGFKPTKGILLYGPPGTGKTTIAKIIASKSNANLTVVSGTEFTCKWYGESEANLRRIFEDAQANKPSIILFDELEAFLPKRQEMAFSDSPEKGIVATFLAYTDGVKNTDGILLIGATNHPQLIDPAALRPGRFDKLIYIPPPDINDRECIFRLYLKNQEIAKDMDFSKLAQQTERFTGADIERICSDAVKMYLRKPKTKKEKISMSDIINLIKATKPTITLKMLKEYEEIAEKYTRRTKIEKSQEVIKKEKLSWQDVGGLEHIRQILEETILLPLTKPELLEYYNIKPVKGILLYGPPGCGKTFIAKVLASEGNINFIDIKGPEFLSEKVGQAEEKIRDVFIRARENVPCILFFDEIDAIASSRGGLGQQTATQIVTQLLTEMDGMEQLQKVIVIAATNAPDSIDTALLRPGRFDKLVYIPPPDKGARRKLVEIYLKNRPIDKNIEWAKLVELTEGYSCADISAICNEASMLAMRASIGSEKKQLITMQYLIDTIYKSKSSISKDELVRIDEFSKNQRGI